MCSSRASLSFLGLLAAVLGAEPARGGFIEFLNDRDGWIDAAGSFTTIHFNELPRHTFVTDQYADLGVLFTDGDDQIDRGGAPPWMNDGWGLDGNGDINIVFDTPTALDRRGLPWRPAVPVVSKRRTCIREHRVGAGRVRPVLRPHCKHAV